MCVVNNECEHCDRELSLKVRSVWKCPAGTSGSDSPGQAVEAEEIVKQLDMEQVDEITTSTATSTNGAAFPGQAVQVRAVNNGLGDTEEPGDRDLPPLTGKGQGTGLCHGAERVLRGIQHLRLAGTPISPSLGVYKQH